MAFQLPPGARWEDEEPEALPTTQGGQYDSLLPEGARWEDDTGDASADAPAPQTSTLEAIGRGITRVPLFNYDSELASIIKNTRVGLPEFLGGGGVLQTDWDQRNADFAADEARGRVAEEEHPYATFGGDIAGAILTAPMVPVKALQAGNFLARAARGTTLSGAGAFVAGTGEGEGDIVDRAKHGVGNIPAGLVGGALGETAATGINRLFRGARPLSEAQERAARAKEFDIDLLRHQATRDVADTRVAENLRHSSVGSGSRQLIEDADRAQELAMRAAEDRIGADLAGGRSLTSATGAEAGQLVLDAVRAAERTAKKGVDDAYEVANARGAAVDMDVIKTLPDRIFGAVRKTGLVPTEALTPRTVAFMRDLSQGIDQLSQIGGDAAQVTGVKLRWLDAQRKAINLYTGELKRKAPDAVGLNAARREIDRVLGEAFNDGMISGDDLALEALKNARALSAEYKARYTRRGGKERASDATGREIERMLDKKDMTGQELANKLFAQTNIKMAPYAAALATRVKELVGENSPAWASVREGMWKRVLTPRPGAPMRGPQAQLSQIGQFLETEVAKRLYSKEELALMQRYADVLADVVPNKKGTQPSKSSYNLIAAAQNTFLPMIAGMLSFVHGGGPTGTAVAMAAAKYVGGKADNITAAIRAQRELAGAPGTIYGKLDASRAAPGLGMVLGAPAGNRRAATEEDYWTAASGEEEPAAQPNQLLDLPFDLPPWLGGQKPAEQYVPMAPEGNTFSNYRQSENVFDLSRPETVDPQAFRNWSPPEPYVGNYYPQSGDRGGGLGDIRGAYIRSLENFEKTGQFPFPDGPLPPIGGKPRRPIPMPRPRPSF